MGRWLFQSQFLIWLTMALINKALHPKISSRCSHPQGRTLPHNMKRMLSCYIYKFNVLWLSEGILYHKQAFLLVLLNRLTLFPLERFNIKHVSSCLQMNIASSTTRCKVDSNEQASSRSTKRSSGIWVKYILIMVLPIYHASNSLHSTLNRSPFIILSVPVLHQSTHSLVSISSTHTLLRFVTKLQLPGSHHLSLCLDSLN